VFDGWKGWGPKGLAFKRIGTVMADLKRPAPGVDTFQYLRRNYFRMFLAVCLLVLRF
jgi:hypothetical protein